MSSRFFWYYKTEPWLNWDLFVFLLLLLVRLFVFVDMMGWDGDEWDSLVHWGSKQVCYLCPAGFLNTTEPREDCTMDIKTFQTSQFFLTSYFNCNSHRIKFHFYLRTSQAFQTSWMFQTSDSLLSYSNCKGLRMDVALIFCSLCLYLCFLNVIKSSLRNWIDDLNKH